MFISVHIPKTGGTTFRNFLEQRYPGKVAYDYGSDSELTHRLLREKRKEASPEVLRQLKQEGIRVVHGHFPATRYAEAIPNPAAYWVWLRDPVERMISHYSFLRENRLPSTLAVKIREGTMTFEEYLGRRNTNNVLTRYTEPFDIEDFGFLGLVEHYDLSLCVGGFTDTITRHPKRNVTKNKVQLAAELLEMFRQKNARDIALYRTAGRLLGWRAHARGVTLAACQATSAE